MTDILIPFGNRCLALTQDELATALARGQEILSWPSADEVVVEDKILDAEGVHELTGIPASWFLEQARQGNIPHLRAGKYVRFRLREVLLALQIDLHTDRRSVASKNNAPGQQLRRTCYHTAPKKRTT